MLIQVEFSLRATQWSPFHRGGNWGSGRCHDLLQVPGCLVWGWIQAPAHYKGDSGDPGEGFGDTAERGQGMWWEGGVTEP